MSSTISAHVAMNAADFNELLLLGWSCADLVIVDDRLRRPSAQFKLGAHPLQARSKRFNLLLLVRGSRLEVFLLLRHR